MTAPFVRVALPRPVEETFHYEIPDHLAGKVVPGSIVHVPFGKQTMTGVVVELTDSSPVPARSIFALTQGPPLPGNLWTSPVGQLLTTRALSA